MIVLIFLAIFGIPLITVIAIGTAVRKRKNNAWNRWLEANGWRKVPRDMDLWNHVLILRQFAGKRALREVQHVAGEHKGVRFEVVKFVRTTVGNEVALHGFAVFAPRPVPGPELRLVPKQAQNWLGKAETVSMGHPEFDKACRVVCPDPNFAVRALHGLADGLARDPRLNDQVIDFTSTHLVMFSGHNLSEKNVTPMLDLLADMHGAIPWQSLGAAQQ